MRKIRRNFNDSELSLFGALYHTTPPTYSTGRGQGSMGNESSADSSRQIKECRYSVLTRTIGMFAKRVFATTLTPWGGSGIRTVEVEIQADTSTLRGYGFMNVRIGDKTVWISQKDARNLAQVLNAAANSCNANWRKSSITS